MDARSSKSLFWDFDFDIPFLPCSSPYQNGVLSALAFPKRNTLRFGKIVAIPFGLACAFSDENNLFTVVLGLVIVGYGVKSFVRMVKGAFLYNSGHRRWLALFARVSVILLLLFALSELQSRYERYKRGQLGLIRGVFLPLAVFAHFYKVFVAPLIYSHLYGFRSSFRLG